MADTTTTPTAQVADPSTAAAPAAVPAATDAPASMSQDALIAALDDGIRKANGDDAPKPAAAPDAAAAAAKPDAAAAPDANAAATGKADGGEPVKPQTDAERTQAVETEIKQLGMRPQAAERFRELSGENASLKRALHDAGLKDPSELKAIAERAQAAAEWEQIVNSTAATPQQLGSAFEYLRLVNSGTPDALNKAFEMMSAEVAALGKALGRDIAAVHDPLAEHSDLQQAVQTGDITRAHALEVAKARALTRIEAARGKQTADAEARTVSENAAVAALNALGTRLQQADPDYLAKVEILKPALRIIRSTLPPDQWASAVHQAYNELPQLPRAAPAPAPAASAPVGPVPVRPTGAGRPGLAKQTFTDPLEALEAGIARANGERT